MRKLMIDIETMSSESDAVMIQLAGAFFEWDGTVHKQFSMNIDEESCKIIGFKESASTVEWWKTQNQQVLENIRKDAQPVEFVILKFLEFLGDTKDICVWSHATFDFVIVQNYIKKLSNKYMSFKLARDIRTLVDLSGIDLSKYDWNKKTHNALDDVLFQIEYCCDAYKLLKGDK